MSELLAALGLSPGTAVAVVAAVAWAILDVQRKKLAARLHPAAVVIWLNGSAIPLFLALAVGVGDAVPDPAWWPWLAGSVSASLSAQVLYMISVRQGELSVVIPMLSLTPALGALLDLGIYGQQLTALQVLGLVVVVGGSLLNGALGRGLRLSLPALMMAGVGLLFSVQSVVDKGALAHAGAALHAAALCLGNVAALTAWLAFRGELRELALPRELRRTLLLAVGVVVAAFGLQLVAFTMVPVGVVEGIKRGLSLPAAALAGVVAFGEQIPPWRVGLLLVMATGVALLA